MNSSTVVVFNQVRERRCEGNSKSLNHLNFGLGRAQGALRYKAMNKLTAATLTILVLAGSAAILAQQAVPPPPPPTDIAGFDNGAEPDEPGRPVARLSVASGEVSIKRGDGNDWVAGALNAPLMEGDAISVSWASPAWKPKPPRMSSPISTGRLRALAVAEEEVVALPLPPPRPLQRPRLQPRLRRSKTLARSLS